MTYWILFPLPSENVFPWEEPPPGKPGEWQEEWSVTEEELTGAVKRMRARNTAPGPNGILGRVWALDK